MRDFADRFRSMLTQQLRAVAADLEAFQILADAVKICLDACQSEMASIIGVATGRSQGPRDESVGRAADEEFAKMRRVIEAKLSIARFDFEQSKGATLVSDTKHLPGAKNKGGRPSAEFWDDLWAAVAFALYTAGLDPKKQADVENFMLDWLAQRGQSAATSTIKLRARKLWALIEADL